MCIRDRLRSLVAIELKIGEFEAEYAGKMQLYLSVLDEQIKLPEENPSIGIIICKSKDKTYVELSLIHIYLLTRERMQVIAALLEKKNITVITSMSGCMDYLLPDVYKRQPLQFRQMFTTAMM